MAVNQTSSNSQPERDQGFAEPGELGDFWRFSCGLYARGEVAEICLALQNSYGWDVNLALFGLWLAARKRGAEAELVEAAIAFSANWRAQKVAPLRALRIALKSEAVNDRELAAFREKVKALESEAERLQQFRLEEMFVHSRSDEGGAYVERADAALEAIARGCGLGAADQNALLRKLVAEADDFLQIQVKQSVKDDAAHASRDEIGSGSA